MSAANDDLWSMSVETVEPLPPDVVRRLRRAQRLARLLDARFRLPLVRVGVGLDAIIGLIPGIGDTLTLAAAGYIVHEARKLGVPPDVLGRMLANIGVDYAIGLVPIAGDLLDIGFRANTRNVDLLEADLRRRHAAGSDARVLDLGAEDIDRPTDRGFAIDEDAR